VTAAAGRVPLRRIKECLLRLLSNVRALAAVKRTLSVKRTGCCSRGRNNRHRGHRIRFRSYSSCRIARINSEHNLAAGWPAWRARRQRRSRCITGV
jgi:hypothetical protein